MSHLACTSGSALRQVADVEAPRVRAASKSAGESAGLNTFPTLLTCNQAAASLGVSLRTFQWLRNEPWMPRPVVLGPRLLRWPRVEIERAVADMPRQTSPAMELADLRRAKIEKLKAGAAA